MECQKKKKEVLGVLLSGNEKINKMPFWGR